MGRHSHRNSTGSESVRKEFALLDGDAMNPVMQRMLAERNPECLIHKRSGKVIYGPLKRKHIFYGHSIQEVLQRVFVNSDLLCENLVKEGFEGFDKTGAQNKLQTPEERHAFIEATRALPVAENRWHRRYGMGKDFAPRFSPISWWVYISEDQYIQFKPESGEIHVTLDIISLELGEHLRTVRLFDLKSIGPDSVEVTMQYGAINTHTGQVDREVCGIREQAFREAEDPQWKWSVRAEEILGR